MDTMKAFMLAQANAGKEHKVFDWDKAAQIIKDRGFPDAAAGLSEDWGWTGGVIFSEGIPVGNYTYLSSNWATPELELDDAESIPCFCMESEHPEWGSDTKWPLSSLIILFGEEAGQKWFDRIHSEKEEE